MAEDAAESGSRKDPPKITSKDRKAGRRATLTGFFHFWLNWTLDIGLWQQQQAIPPWEFRRRPR